VSPFPTMVVWWHVQKRPGLCSGEQGVLAEGGASREQEKERGVVKTRPDRIYPMRFCLTAWGSAAGHSRLAATCVKRHYLRTLQASENNGQHGPGCSNPGLGGRLTPLQTA